MQISGGLVLYFSRYLLFRKIVTMHFYDFDGIPEIYCTIQVCRYSYLRIFFVEGKLRIMVN